MAGLTSQFARHREGGATDPRETMACPGTAGAPPLERASRRLPWPQIVIALAAMGILVVHALQYLPFIEDDAFISLRYARRLITGHGLTWTDGQPVEGYSNLLWVLLNSLLGLGGVDLVLSTRILGLMGMCVAIAAIVRGAVDHRRGAWPSAIVAALMFALANPVGVWAIGGLEQPLLIALLAWAAVLCRPLAEDLDAAPARAWTPALLLGLLSLTRPDGILFAVSAAAAILVINRASRRAFRAAFVLIALPAACYLAQLAFRLSYYGEWVPNTALVKLTPSMHHFAGGAKYLADGLVAMTPLSWLALAFLVVGLFIRAERRWLAFLLILGGSWAAYVVFIGGDCFPSWRHGIALVLVMALILARCIAWLAQYARDSGWKGAIVVAMIALFTWFVQTQRSQAYQNRWLIEADWQWSGRAIGEMLKQGFGDQQPVLATSSAGSLPYWSELPAIDMLGLNDYYLPRHPPADLGSGLLGHELGSGRYVLERQPDLVIFHGGGGRADGVFPGEKQMQARPEFGEQYTLAHFITQGPRRYEARIWMRRHSEKIGILSSADRIDIPAYFLNADPGTAAYLDNAGRFVVPISSPQPAGIREVVLSPGRWRVEAAATSALRIDLRPTDAAAGTVTRLSANEFEITGSGKLRVDLMLEPVGPSQVEVHGLRLTRAGA